MVLLGLLVPAALMTKLCTKKAGIIPPLTTATLGLVSVLIAGVAFRALMFLIGSSVRQFF
jgi:anaerobic dimethyl sulfoxide reductase subunit C (anchor subunit)